jgi:hypothetical protein
MPSDQYGGGPGDTTQLEHTEKPLVDSSARVPPEILVQIFYLDAAPDERGGLRKGSYQFLFVCRHWYNIAKAAPELWSFWGNNLYHWSQRYQLSGRSAPVDLTMFECESDLGLPINKALRRSTLKPMQIALNERVASNSIRSIHLWGFVERENIINIGSIVSSLASGGGGIRYSDSSIESIEIVSTGLDVSSFLTSYRFPQLRHLILGRMAVDSKILDHLSSCTGSLTSLSLGHLGGTLDQLLSVLDKNHQLRSLTLVRFHVDDSDARCQSQVSLPHLKRLVLSADFHSTFRLLDQLDLPKSSTMDFMEFVLSDCPDSEDVSRSVGRYMQDFLSQDRFKGRLVIFASGFLSKASIHVSTKDTSSRSTLLPTGEPRFNVQVECPFGPGYSGHRNTMLVNLASYIPKGDVISFTGRSALGAMGEVVATMPNIQKLCLRSVLLSVGFMKLTSPANTKLLPSLRCLILEEVDIDRKHGWRPLLDYLRHRQTSGGQRLLLRIVLSDRNDIGRAEEREIRGLVEKLDISVVQPNKSVISSLLY